MRLTYNIKNKQYIISKCSLNGLYDVFEKTGETSVSPTSKVKIPILKVKMLAFKTLLQAETFVKLQGGE